MLNAELRLYGDINGDGRISTADVGLANAHAKGTTELTGYLFDVAEVTGDGRVTTADCGRINAHAKGTSYIW